MSKSTGSGGPWVRRAPRGVSLWFGIMAVVVPGAALAERSSGDLLDLSIAELLHVEVTSASKKAQRVDATATAVFVISRHDIQRTGARSIPEALRLAPGLDVAQIDANKWAISARGFNGRFANKLLVLRDGRALYTPTFGGVFWDVQDTVMEDVERIEVIRGPGGTLWGANAVNGVINIITRSAEDTQGAEVVAAAATGANAEGSARYGGRSSETTAYRVYAKYLDAGGNVDLAGRDTDDDSRLGRVGIRVDGRPNERDQWSLTSEAYDGRFGETVSEVQLMPPYVTTFPGADEVSGFFTTLRWQRTLSAGREFQLHAYYDATNRAAHAFGEDRRSAALDLQYHWPVGARHDLVAGAGYRRDDYSFSQGGAVLFTPSNPGSVGYNAFVQDEIQLLPEQLSLTLGVDFEHNALSDESLIALPSGRLLWSIDEDNHAWAAVTKAVGTPSYKETGASVRNVVYVAPPGDPTNPFPVPMVTNAIGNRDFRPVELVAYELGYRTQLTDAVTLDAAVFRHEYRDLWAETLRDVYCEPSNTSVFVNPLCFLGATNVVTQLRAVNGLDGSSRGFELAADWSPSPRVRLHANYTYLTVSLEPNGTVPVYPSFVTFTEQTAPRHQASLRGDFSLASRVDLDVAVRYVGQLPFFHVGQYWSADANLNWHLRDGLDLALTGRNLLSPAHEEYVSELTDVVPTQIERTLGARIRWSF